MSEDNKIDNTGKTRRVFVTKAAQVAVTAPAASILLASVKPAAAQISVYQAQQQHILDDFTFGNNEEDIDALELGSNFNPINGQANLDDVVQEIFMVAFRRQDEFEGRSSVKTWLYGIVFNVVRAHRRELVAKHPHALHAERRANLDVIADVADGPHERTAKREAARFINRFLETLDEDRRDVFVLAELEQLTAPEIAALTGAPLNTVYSRLRLARAEFTKAVARHHARDIWRRK